MNPHFPLIMTRFTACLTALFLWSVASLLQAQMVTGTWHGKIGKQKVETKIILNGDSLTGTSYYYESANNYRRYSIKGYFDPATNNVIWWDDQLLDEKSGRFSLSTPGKMPMLSRADFNCPGGSRMMLDGDAAKKDNETTITGEVHLVKGGATVFPDEWDFVIDNYTLGANDPDIIDSIASISGKPILAENTPPEPTETVIEKPVEKVTSPPPPVIAAPAPVEKTNPVAAPPAIEQKFTSRTKQFIREIPLTGDSLELRFYDNAEIDGDSISLFLNNKLIFEHIRLTGNAYIIKLPVKEMNPTNELIMVAENMGSIPPNTSYMVAIVDGKRYDAYLTSTEGSSAMIRFTKTP